MITFLAVSITVILMVYLSRWSNKRSLSKIEKYYISELDKIKIQVDNLVNKSVSLVDKNNKLNAEMDLCTTALKTLILEYNIDPNYVLRLLEGKEIIKDDINKQIILDIDIILEKISKSGIKSLSSEELNYLNKKEK